jgi:hypothetical protein
MRVNRINISITNNKGEVMKQYTLTMTETEVCKILDHLESMVDSYVCEGDEDSDEFLFYREFLTKITDSVTIQHPDVSHLLEE